jgi:DNA-binding LacI/PurR family transcriptional regulator
MTTSPESTPTIYDVATRAGVSISTVSLAFNAPARVNAATLERIMAAVDELGYVPKTEAVTRARRGVGRIGVIAPFTAHATFAQRLNGVLRAAAGERFEVVVYDQESAATSRLATLPLTRRVDGLIVMSVPFTEEVARRLVDQRVTTVLVELQHPRFSSVVIDDVAGGRLVADHLVERGHKRFGFIGQIQQLPDQQLQSGARLDGFRRQLESSGIALDDRDVRLADHSIDAACSATRELLERDDRPTAIFAHDDLLASGVLRAARELCLAVPRDLAVVGFDDGDIAAPLGLTSVRQPLEESGEIATQMLLAQLESPTRSARVTSLSLTLVERETS